MFVKLKKVEIENGMWIEVPEKLSFKDLTDIEEILYKGDFKDLKKAFEVSLIIIKNWNFQNEDGSIVEFNRENLGKLDKETVEKVSLEVNKLMPKVEDRKKKSQDLQTQ